MVLGCPFDKLESSDQNRLQPPTLLHLLRCKTLPPTAATFLGQVGKRACLDFKWAKLLENARTERWSESVPRPRCIHQFAVLVVANDQRVEVLRARSVAANHQVLTLVDAHLLPAARALSGFVNAIPSLRNQSFQSLRLHRTDQIRQARFQLR